jgi:hypothetical protein
MKKAAVAMLLLLVIVTAFAVVHTRRAYAQSDQTLTIPKSYGTFKGAMGNGRDSSLIFEDAQGTIRLVSWPAGRLQATFMRQ